MEMSRNKLQEASMTIIYDALLYIDMKKEIDIKSMISNYFNIPIEDCDIYVKEVCYNVILHFNDIVETLNKNMHKWKFSRLNFIAQAILLLSYSHYYYVEGSNKSIVINIAIKLAKKYLEDKDYKYINAVLDNVLC